MNKEVKLSDRISQIHDQYMLYHALGRCSLLYCEMKLNKSTKGKFNHSKRNYSNIFVNLKTALIRYTDILCLVVPKMSVHV